MRWGRRSGKPQRGNLREAGSGWDGRGNDQGLILFLALPPPKHQPSGGGAVGGPSSGRVGDSGGARRRRGELQGFERKQSGGAGSVASPACGRPLSAQSPGAGERGLRPRPAPQNARGLISAPYPRIGPHPVACSEDPPGSGAPTRSSPQGEETGSREEGLGGGVRDPGGAPHTLAHPERPAVDRGPPCRASAPAGDGAARLGPGAWLSGTTRLPSGMGGRAGGRGREIRSHNIGLPPSPPQTFHRGWERRGQSRSLARIPAADRTARGTLAGAPLRPRGCGAAGAVRPTPETLRSSRGGRRKDPRVQPSPPPRLPAPQPLSLPRPAAPAQAKGQSGGSGAPRLQPHASPASLTYCAQLQSPGAALAFGSDRRPPLPPRRRLPALARQPSAASLPPPLRPRPAPRP
ncbi:collagen alpha-1(I) chain-like [Homo sapiens]|uniref:collagen alpha-1(I) chain-like n=1 Tax=Homo sapiens TaxID=9606 RepID=UPI001FB15162|nr:collagen alpha-1(I) chain-like [Homo sapiens]